VPDEVGFLAQDVPEDVLAIVIAPGAREDEDREAHLVPV
jgi:hypothetical protein